MIGGRPRTYNRSVGFQIGRQGLAGLLFALLLAATNGARASADSQTIATTAGPIIFGQLQYGSITVHTWDRPEVEIDAEPTVDVRHIEHVPQSLPFQPFFIAQTVQSPEGELRLPAEPFLVPQLDTSPHDAVGFHGFGNVTITIPAGSPLVIARVGEGEVTIDGYHGGTFFALVRAGLLHLNDVGGTGGFQVNNGPAIVQNSNFDRIRARTGRGNMFFENTTSRQIDATSLTGSIVYDNGSFEPGLARFETQRGNIALGVARGGAQIDAHSGSGKVLSEGSFPSGPVVTATSGTGNVMYYNGSIRSHPALQRQLPIRPMHGVPRRRRGPPRRAPGREPLQ